MYQKCCLELNQIHAPTQYNRSIEVCFFYEPTVSHCRENKRPLRLCSTELHWHSFQPSCYITVSYLCSSILFFCKNVCPTLFFLPLLFLTGHCPTYLPSTTSALFCNTPVFSKELLCSTFNPDILFYHIFGNIKHQFSVQISVVQTIVSLHVFCNECGLSLELCVSAACLS